MGQGSLVTSMFGSRIPLYTPIAESFRPSEWNLGISRNSLPITLPLVMSRQLWSFGLVVPNGGVR